MTTPTTLGQRLYAARKSLDLSQDEVGAAVGVGQQQVGRWEKDTHRPNDRHMALLARALKIPLEELYALKAAAAEKLAQEAMRDRDLVREALLMVKEELQRLSAIQQGQTDQIKALRESLRATDGPAHRRSEQ